MITVLRRGLALEVHTLRLQRGVLLAAVACLLLLVPTIDKDITLPRLIIVHMAKLHLLVVADQRQVIVNHLSI